MKYMALRADVQRREKKKISQGDAGCVGSESPGWGVGDPPGRGSADTCDTGVTPVGGAQGAASARYHDTPHAAARRGQRVSENARGLGGARAGQTCCGPSGNLRGGAGLGRSTPRAMAMVRLSPRERSWWVVKCDIDDTLYGASGIPPTGLSSSGNHPRVQGARNVPLLGWVAGFHMKTPPPPLRSPSGTSTTRSPSTSADLLLSADSSGSCFHMPLASGLPRTVIGTPSGVMMRSPTLYGDFSFWPAAGISTGLMRSHRVGGRGARQGSPPSRGSSP